MENGSKRREAEFFVSVQETRSETFRVAAESREAAEDAVREAFCEGGRPRLGQASELSVEVLTERPRTAGVRDFDEACEEDEENVCSVESRIGILRAHIWGEGAIEVELCKPDGTGGQVALVEVTPESLIGEYKTDLHVFAWNGKDEDLARIDVDPNGDEMQYR